VQLIALANHIPSDPGAEFESRPITASSSQESSKISDQRDIAAERERVALGRADHAPFLGSVMALTADLTAMALIEPLHGLSFALLHLASMRLLGEMVPAGLAATAQAIYGTVAIGATTSLLTLASGTLYGRLGAGGFWAMAALCLCALPFIVQIGKPRRRTCRVVACR
jgi:hypothetical protein